MIAALNCIILYAPCSGMDYMHTVYNTTTTKIATNLINARNWTNNFIEDIRLKLYALLRINNLKTITGLDEDKLDTYTISELDDAKRQIGKMIMYSNESSENEPSKLDTLYKPSKLDTLYSKLQGPIESLKHAAKQERINQDIEEAYDPEEAELLFKQKPLWD